jgi:outer membrane protein assembly factor BamB
VTDGLEVSFPLIHKLERLSTYLSTFCSSYAKNNRKIHDFTDVANGLVYIGSGAGIVYALDAQTGKLKWSYQTGDIVASAPAVANGIVYVGSFDKYLYALNAQTGTLIWKYNTGKIIYYSSPVVANGVVYVGVSYNKQVSLLALDDQKGTLLWNYNRGGNVTGDPIVANGFFYIGIDKIMYAFSLPGLKS